MIAKAGDPFTTNRSCPVCRQKHLTVARRQDGMGFVCNYRTPTEHTHDSYEELRVCQGTAPEKMAERAARKSEVRKGTRNRPYGLAHKPLRPERPMEVPTPTAA
jgi:hypothetical protein